MKKYIVLLLFLLVSIENVYGLNIVSFGDSIPHGYLLKDINDSYDNQIAETLDANYYEYSVVGMTSYQLLEYLETHESDDEIKNADMIFICIGSNDYLDLLFELELDGLELDTSAFKYLDIKDDFNFNSFFASLKRSITSEDFINKGEATLDRIKDVYPKIISYIKNLNGNAKIYILNLYNPYFNLSNPLIDLDYVADICEEYITKTNEFLASSNEYTIIDAHEILRNYKLINVDLLKLNLDPHPNKYGHQALYDAFLKELTYKVEVYESDDKSNIYYVLKGDSLKVKEPTKKGYKFVKWDHDLDNINSNITIKPVFKKDYTNYIIIGCVVITIIVISIIFIKKRKRA